MLTPYKRIQSTFDSKTLIVSPVDEAVANLIAALDGESVLAFSSAPSDEESTVHLDRRMFQRNPFIFWSNLVDKHCLCSWSVNIRHEPGLLIIVR